MTPARRLSFLIRLAPIFAFCFVTPAMADDAEVCHKGDSDTSVVACTRLIESGAWSGKNLANVYYSRGRAYDFKGRSELAFADYNRAVQLDPANSLNHTARGLSYERLSRFNEALADYRRALSLDRHDQDAAEGIRRLGSVVAAQSPQPPPETHSAGSSPAGNNSKPALAAGPATSQDWQRLYDACLEGTRRTAKAGGLTPDAAPAICACVRDSLQGTPKADWDAKFRGILNTCVQSASASSQTKASDWPPTGITTLRTICYQQPRKDAPPQSLDGYCSCYIELLPKAISWRDWVMVDAAVRAKGMQNLEGQERSIMIKALETATDCFLKNVRQ